MLLLLARWLYKTHRQHNSPDQFMSHFEETIEKLTSLNKNVFIMGDFNIDLLKCETSQISHDFLMSLQSCYLIPTVDKPTRVHRNSATLIDNIFLNNPDQILLSGNIISGISDHFAQFCIIKAARDKYRGYTTKIRDFSNFSADQFNRKLSEVDWECILVNHATDPDKLFSTFYKKFNKIVNKHAPITN